MTLHSDVADGRDLLACWRELAEHRLDYLTRMFESGRWRRYYSELAFLENIREAKIAVDKWRGLSEWHAMPRPTAIAASWSAPPRLSGLPKLMPRPVPIAVEPITVEPIVVAPRVDIIPFAAEPPAKIPAAAEPEPAAAEELRAAPPIDLLPLERALKDMLQLAPDITMIEQRYPLLRNTF